MSKIIRAMPDGDYRKIDALSKHDSDELSKNPYAFFKRKATGWRKEPTEAMKLGTAVHTAILQPWLFNEQYAIIPPEITVKRGKAWEAFQAENEGKECLKLSQRNQIMLMAESLVQCKDCSNIFNAAKPDDREVVLLSECNEVSIKSKADIVCPELGIIADVKTASDASPDAFIRQASDLSYDVQAAWYLINAQACGLNVDTFAFLVVENEFPYSTGVYTFSRFSDFVMAGECEMKHRIEEYKHFSKAKVYEEYNGWSVKNMTLPPWNKHLKQLEETKS